jgi:hypothetical protein
VGFPGACENLRDDNVERRQEAISCNCRGTRGARFFASLPPASVYARLHGREAVVVFKHTGAIMKCVPWNAVLATAALLSITMMMTGNVTAAPATGVACNGCVGPSDLAPAAKPAGSDFTDPVNNSTFTTETVITSVTLNLPGPGVVILNSGGWVVFNDNPSGVVCAITTGTTISGEPQVVAQNHNVANARRMPIATTRGFRETSGGPKTYNLVCTPQGDADLFDVILTATFGPRRY